MDSIVEGMGGEVGRTVPHSLEAEQGVLGCIMLEPNECLPDCVACFKPGAEVFYDLRHGAIYMALVHMHDARQPIDLITVQQRLKDTGQLEQVGGIAYLCQLSDIVPSAANLSYYAGIIWDKYLLRRMIETARGIVSRIYSYEGEVARLVDEVQADLLRIAELNAPQTDASMKALVSDALGDIEALWQRKGSPSGIATGFRDFDRLTGGLQRGEMIVIAGRPSMGKTSWAFNVAENVAVSQGIPVGVFSLEMSKRALTVRSICSLSKLNLRAVSDGFLNEAEFQRMGNAAAKLASAPLYIDDTSGISILQLRSKARQMNRRHGIQLLVIDYLQLLHSTSRRAENRQQEIADISGGIKGLAKELNLPVIVLSQLNRLLEREKGRPPRLSDLRESGSIEQDADLVAMLHNPNAGAENDGGTAPAGPRQVALLIAKQRNGESGVDVPLVFFPQYTRFESASKVAPADL